MTKNKSLRKYARFSGLAFEMIAIIGGGSFAGVKLDQRNANEFPLFTLIFSLSSVMIALYLVIKAVIKTSKEDDKKSNK